MTTISTRGAQPGFVKHHGGIHLVHTAENIENALKMWLPHAKTLGTAVTACEFLKGLMLGMGVFTCEMIPKPSMNGVIYSCWFIMDGNRSMVYSLDLT